MPRGHPRKFSSAKQLVELWIDFNEDIRRANFIMVPNQSNFCRWLAGHYEGCDRRTIYNSLNKYFPTIKKQFESIQGDTIAEGAMLGHYQSTMSIFALKNWCHWCDSPAASDTADAAELPHLYAALEDDV